jgi:hypothetical protein
MVAPQGLEAAAGRAAGGDDSLLSSVLGACGETASCAAPGVLRGFWRTRVVVG